MQPHPDARPRAARRREHVVLARYGAAAQRREQALCCPVQYDPRYLEVIPPEVLERDYGCGDPSRFVRAGDIVLDLGSGSGKVCFIAAQIAGPEGRVIGIDANLEMLDLARRAKDQVTSALGYENVEFRRGRVQDLGLDLEALETWLEANPVRDLPSLAALASHEQWLRRQRPLVADASVDLVISNCVLNLVDEEDKSRLGPEIFRVLRPGGRVALSDIVSDRPVPDHLKDDPELWSGCVSGAFHLRDLLRELERAGFRGIRIESWSDEPFAVIDGISFRSVTVTAVRPHAPGNRARGGEVIYRGPWARVEDEAGCVFERGRSAPVDAEVFERLRSDCYEGHLIAIPHADEGAASDGRGPCCSPGAPNPRAGSP